MGRSSVITLGTRRQRQEEANSGLIQRSRHGNEISDKSTALRRRIILSVSETNGRWEQCRVNRSK